MFTVLVASDILGEKVNLEVGFPSGRPTLHDLKDEVEKAFGAEVVARAGDAEGRRMGYRVSRFQLFDEGAQRWAPVAAPTQLVDFAQIYAFQPPNAHHKEVRAPIPPPVKARTHPAHAPASPPAVVAASAALRGASQPSLRREAFSTHYEPAAAAPEDVCFEDKVASVYEDIADGKPRVGPAEWQHAFGVLGIHFSSETVADLYGKAAKGAEVAEVTLADLRQFYEHHPALLDSMYQRFRFYRDDLRRQLEVVAAEEELRRLEDVLKEKDATRGDLRQDIANVVRRLDDGKVAIQHCVEQHQRLEGALRDAARASEHAQKKLGAQDTDLLLQRERERLAHAALSEAGMEEAAFAQRVQAAAGDVSRAESALRQQLDELNDAQTAQQRAEHEVANARGQLADADNDARGADQLRADAAAHAQQVGQGLQAANIAIAGLEAQERQANLAHQEAVSNIQKGQLVKGEEERSLQCQREAERHLQNDRLAAEKASGHQEKELEKLQEDSKAFLERLKGCIEQERPLIHEEVKLREQRNNLEVKETALRHNQRAFYYATYAGPAGGSPGRSVAASVPPAVSQSRSPFR